MPWRYVTLTGCRWPQPYSSVGVCINRIQKFGWPLHKAGEHVAAVGRQGVHCRGKAWSISTLWAWAVFPAWAGSYIELSFIISRTISGLWKYVLSCLGCYLTSSIGDYMQTSWWKLLQWFLLSSEKKWLVPEQGEPTLPYFTPRPLDFSVIQISQLKNWCWSFHYHLDQNQDGERKDFTQACQNTTITLPEYVWYKKTDNAIDKHKPGRIMRPEEIEFFELFDVTIIVRWAS